SVAGYRQYDRIRPPALRQLFNGPYGLRGGSVDVFVQAERLSYCMPLRKQIGSHYPRTTTARQHRQDDANRALADQQHRFSGRKPQRFNTFHAGVYGLDERRSLERNAIRNTDDSLANDPLHHPNIFGKTASAGLVARGRADFLVGRTLGEHLMLAIEAFPAGDVVKHHHAVAQFVAGNLFAERSNHTGRFMAKDARGGMGTGCDLLEISAADAAGVNANQDLSRADLRHRDSLHADVVHAAINCRLHGCGERLLADGTTELGCARHVGNQLSVASSRLPDYWLLPSIRCCNARHRFAEAI